MCLKTMVSTEYTSTYSARVLLIALYPSGSDSATQKPIRLVPNWF